MSKKVGVTKETLHNLVLDAGYVYINYKLDGEKAIGATTDGNTFTAEREIKEIEADNMKGKTKGMRRIISYNASLGVNFFEQTPENIKMAFSAADIT